MTTDTVTSAIETAKRTYGGTWENCTPGRCIQGHEDADFIIASASGQTDVSTWTHVDGLGEQWQRFATLTGLECRCCGKPVHAMDDAPIHTRCIPRHWGKHARGTNASRCKEFGS